jgi:hypothetical protein
MTQVGDRLDEVHVIAVPVGFGERQRFSMCLRSKP